MSFPFFIYSIAGIICNKLLDQPDISKLSKKTRLILIGIIDLVSFLFALASNDFQPTLGLGGAISTCLIGIIFPFVCILKKSSKGFRYHKNVIRIGICVFFIIIFCISTYTSFSDLISSQKGKNRAHIE